MLKEIRVTKTSEKSFKMSLWDNERNHYWNENRMV